MIFNKSKYLVIGALGGYIATTIDQELAKMGFNYYIGSIGFFLIIVFIMLKEFKDEEKTLK